MTTKLEPLDFKASSRRRLANQIDRVLDDLEVLDIITPKEVGRRMTLAFSELATMQEKLKTQDLNPDPLHSPQKTKQIKERINQYVEMKYKSVPANDTKRRSELYNRSVFKAPSQNLPLNSIEQIGHPTNTKRRFGESWDKKVSFSQNLEVLQKDTEKKEVQRKPELSKYITKMMEKNLGIKLSQNSESLSPRSSGKYEFSSQRNGSNDASGPSSQRSGLRVAFSEQSEPSSPKHSWGGKVQEKIEKWSPRKQNNGFGNFATVMNNALSSFQAVNEEISAGDEEIYGPEYFKYLNDMDSGVSIKKYIGQLGQKKKKVLQKLSKYSRV